MTHQLITGRRLIHILPVFLIRVPILSFLGALGIEQGFHICAGWHFERDLKAIAVLGIEQGLGACALCMTHSNTMSHRIVKLEQSVPL